jgi:hypothetical protein
MNYLVVSPHPDDETLGAGGTLIRHKRSGGQIYWLNVTNMKEEYGYSKELVKIRQQQVFAQGGADTDPQVPDTKLMYSVNIIFTLLKQVKRSFGMFIEQSAFFG